MNTIRTSLPLFLLAGLFATSCASMRDSASVRDDIYYMPSEPPPARTAPAVAQEPEQQQQAEDYYDPNTAKNYDTRNYYDMAYNDPYFYNYGRFGFGSGMGMGWQNGWAGPGWGMGMGYGYGLGGGNWMSFSLGYGSGYYDPWYGGWGYMNPYYRPWGSPWGWRDPYFGGMGWGMGNYYGPFGPCYACYTPVIVGGSSGVVAGHRPSLGGAGGFSTSGGGSQVAQPRSSVFRDPVGLTPASRMDGTQTISRNEGRNRPSGVERGSGRDRTLQPINSPGRPDRGSGGGRTVPERGSGVERGGGGFDRGGGGLSPSRGGGGGTISSPRPR